VEQMGTRIETGFRDVDRTGEAEPFAEYLSHVNNLESVAAGKRAREHLLGLRAGARVIDVGCGLDDDARALSRLVGAQRRSSALIRAPLCWSAHGPAARGRTARSRS
jgi:hypothetical protein